MFHKTGSNDELTYLASVMDFPYQNQDPRFQTSLSSSVINPNILSSFDQLSSLNNDDNQIVPWLNAATWNPQTAIQQQSAPDAASSSHSTKVGIGNGQIDTYYNPESSYYQNSFIQADQPRMTNPDTSTRANVTVHNSESTNFNNNELSDFDLIEDEICFTQTPNLCHSFEIDPSNAFIALDL